MKSETREKANKAFRSFLVTKFLTDLKTAKILTSIQKEERTSEFQGMLDSLRSQYVLGGKCPSLLYLAVSEELQEEYNDFHKGICEVLYGPPSIALPNH